MELAVFAKKLTTKEGKSFYKYSTTLKRRNESGEIEEVKTAVKFREDCGAPKGENCPINIIVDKADCGYTEKIKTYTDEETGEEKDFLQKELWVRDWKEGSPYVDHSMDEFIEE